MTTKDEAFKIVKDLVERFEEQKDSYKSGEYNETLTRRDFIDPFFKALGWDVDNSQGYAEAYREVIHEDKVKIGKATKAPDYSFRIGGGKRLFFVEAKKPSINIKEDITVSYQIRRYGWSAKLPVSIITDFEEFSVYDCTKKPNPTDKSSVARIKYFTFDKYLEEFEYLWDIFSKERVLKGSFDRYVQSDTVRKGTTTVDKEFLISLDTWRTYLATSISFKNRKLDEDEINFAVQQTIDRLIFLRIAEDRGVEPYGQLKTAVNQKGDAYQNLFFNFKKADEKYNSGIFDFKKDTISENLVIDNKVIKTIINEMYYPESPYEFSVISVEILGSAYEQFLGKQIKIDSAHRANIEEKPEVRKAGGVYYTPQYVVEYIVKNTVGKLIENKTPKQIEQIKICDPACGSGSFLIGAYQFLLDYHKNYYTENGTKIGKKDSPITPEGNLTSAEKKRILLNNIYGVDIDINAVEVTKLSLLLKCLEGETETSIAQQYKIWHDRILPTLDSNIKSGNSLVDLDFYDAVIDFGEEKKIKPFSWEKAFPEVFERDVPIDKRLMFKKQFNKVQKLQKETDELVQRLTISEPIAEYQIRNKGFDIIIGNPPYVKVSDKNSINYFSNKYQHQDYQQDLYLLFLERFQKILATGGMLGVIIPNTWLQSIKFRNIRRYLMSEYSWERIMQINEHIFKAVVDTHIIVFEKNNFVKNCDLYIDILEKGESKNYQVINQNLLPDNGDIINVISSEIEKNLFEKIKSKSVFIKDMCMSTVGVKPFQVGKGNPKQTRSIVDDKPFVRENESKPDGTNWLPLMRGSLMNKYISYWNNNSWIEYGEWLAEPRNPKIFKAEEKIIVRQTGDSIIATIIGKDIICRNNLHVLISESLSHKFILGVLNSKLINFFYYQINPEKGEVLAEVKKNHVEQLPLPVITKENQSLYEQIIKLVEQLLLLKKEMQIAKLDSKKQAIESKIYYCETKINQLIYTLYDLTNEEINIVENI